MPLLSTIFLVIVIFVCLYLYKRYRLMLYFSQSYGFPFYYAGKTIVITGANSGLGEALSNRACEYGAKVIMTGRNMESLETARQGIIDNVQELQYVPTLSIMDVSDPKSIKNFVGQYLTNFSQNPPDIIINNAGISFRGEISLTKLAVDRLVMETNYFGPIQLIKGFLPLMIAKRTGVIINISSIQGKVAIPFRSAYSASKHALQAFTDCLRAEVSDSNIFVCLVSPGYIRTKISLNAVTGDGKLYSKMDDTQAHGMDPFYVAEAILKGITGRNRSPEIMLIPWKYRIALWLRSLLPSLFFDIMLRRARKYRGYFSDLPYAAGSP